MAYTFSACLDASCEVTEDNVQDLGMAVVGKKPPAPPLPVLPAGWRWAPFKTVGNLYWVTPAVDAVTEEIRRLFPGATFTKLFEWGGGYVRVFDTPGPDTTVLPRSERMPRLLHISYRTKPRDGGPYIG